jgi:hypothetical protein
MTSSRPGCPATAFEGAKRRANAFVARRVEKQVYLHFDCGKIAVDYFIFTTVLSLFVRGMRYIVSDCYFLHDISLAQFSASK